MQAEDGRGNNGVERGNGQVNFDLKSPCDNCPFTKQECTKGWLHRKRVEEIWQQLTEKDQMFICHKTSQAGQKHQQCAGAIILMHKTKKLNNNFKFRLAQMLSLLDMNKITGRERIFDSAEEMMEWHDG